MIKVIKILALTLSLNVFANDLKGAPSPFQIKEGRAIFVDFIQAHYNLVYNYRTRRAQVETEIIFKAEDTGLPIFDSVHAPIVAALNGEAVSTIYTPTPGEASRVRVVNKIVSPGIHRLYLKTNLRSGTRYRRRGVSSGFFMRDLKDRQLLEKYIPSNYEYDHYKMTMNVRIEGADHRWHDIFANGKVENPTQNSFRIEFPDHYTSSSVFFHLVPRRRFIRLYTQYKSIDGRNIPLTIYSSFRALNGALYRKTVRVLNELEADYGPYPHPQILIYGTSKVRGGMEYVGATETSLVALGHELHHMYFARGVMPVDGNSGWLDEAIASWRDRGYQTHSEPDYFSINLAAHTPYTRKTDSRSYQYGRSFMSYLDYQLKAQRQSLKDFLRGFFVKYKFTSVNTEDFIRELETYSGLSFREDFTQYIFGGREKENNRAPAIEHEHEFHPELTEQEWEELI